MKRFLKNYFIFNKRERNGFLVLLFISALLLVYLYYLSVRNGSVEMDTRAFEKEVLAFEAAQKGAVVNDPGGDDRQAYGHESWKSYRKKEFTAFDPNGRSEAEWMQLGLSKKQAAAVKKFEARGGRFYSKEDVKQLRCISPKQYAALEAYISIPGKEGREKERRPDPYPERRIELNSASRFELLHIALIDSSLAENILKFRNNLGGFYSKEQLKEVTAFDTSLFAKVSAALDLDTENLRQLDVNLASISQLSKHPYIRFNVAKALVLYRETHGNFKTVEDIKKCVLISEALFRKLAPYLVVE